MEKRPYLDLLKRDAKVWNDWRLRNPADRPDLNEADLQIHGQLPPGGRGRDVGAYGRRATGRVGRCPAFGYEDIAGTNTGHADLKRNPSTTV